MRGGFFVPRSRLLSGVVPDVWSRTLVAIVEMQLATIAISGWIAALSGSCTLDHTIPYRHRSRTRICCAAPADRRNEPSLFCRYLPSSSSNNAKEKAASGLRSASLFWLLSTFRSTSTTFRISIRLRRSRGFSRSFCHSTFSYGGLHQKKKTRFSFETAGLFCAGECKRCRNHGKLIRVSFRPRINHHGGIPRVFALGGPLERTPLFC